MQFPQRVNRVAACVQYGSHRPEADRLRSAGSVRKACLRHNAVEEMPARPVLDLDDPGVGIEADFARDPLLDLRLRHGRLAETADERAIARMGVVEG